MWLVIGVIIIVILLIYWRRAANESFLMHYPTMSDSFYYVPPWRRPRMWWGPNAIPIRMMVYDPSRPYWIRG